LPAKESAAIIRLVAGYKASRLVICCSYKLTPSTPIKNKIKFSSYIRKFIVEQLQSLI